MNWLVQFYVCISFGVTDNQNKCLNLRILVSGVKTLCHGLDILLVYQY